MIKCSIEMLEWMSFKMAIKYNSHTVPNENKKPQKWNFNNQQIDIEINVLWITKADKK